VSTLSGYTGQTRQVAALATVIAAFLAGCGGDDSEPSTTSPSPTQPSSPTTRAEGPPPTGDGRGGVTLTRLGDFDQPLYVTQPDDGTGDLYVVEQTGRIQRLPGGDGEPQTFLDLSGEVSCCGEQGLLSVAFAPDYADSGRLYVDYTNVDGDTRVVEYRRSNSDPPVADPGSARELLAVDQPFSNHNGGLVLFGSDGNLYIGLGDGGSAGDPERNGQSLDTLLGKILRLDPRPSGGSPYTVPDDNPFTKRDFASGESYLIYSYGLRNPWRFSFDSKSGDLWIGDVGQDALEEIDGVRDGAGANFGWSAFEGTERFNEDQEAPHAVPPVLTYGRDRGCSVTGGYVVRDPELTSLYGRYLYGDYCEGELRSFTARPEREAKDDRPLGPEIPALSSFGEDTEGNIYATSLDGPVYRIDPAG
jgi:glucose/arabinose dehydrogenase